MLLHLVLSLSLFLLPTDMSFKHIYLIIKYLLITVPAMKESKIEDSLSKIFTVTSY